MFKWFHSFIRQDTTSFRCNQYIVIKRDSTGNQTNDQTSTVLLGTLALFLQRSFDLVVRKDIILLMGCFQRTVMVCPWQSFYLVDNVKRWKPLGLDCIANRKPHMDKRGKLGLMKTNHKLLRKKKNNLQTLIFLDLSFKFQQFQFLRKKFNQILKMVHFIINWKFFFTINFSNSYIWVLKTKIGNQIGKDRWRTLYWWSWWTCSHDQRIEIIYLFISNWKNPISNFHFL